MEQMENLCHDENTVSLKYQDLLLDHFYDVKKVDEKITAELEKLLEDNWQKQFQLEEQSKCLQQREDGLVEKQRKIREEKKKLKLKKSVHKRLSFFKQLVNNCYSSRKEVEGIKMEINMLYKRRAELEEKLNAKSFENLQSEITELERALWVIEDNDKLKDMQSEVIQKREELQAMKELSKVHSLEIQHKNAELQDARQELIDGLKTYPTCSHIGIKRMGLLDTTPFFVGCHSIDKMRENITKFSSITRSLVEDPNWHPFKVIKIGFEKREILDEEDEKIIKLKGECSEEQYHAIVAALNELKECNSSVDRLSVLELWNYVEKRKASLKEGIEYLLDEWKIQKRQKV